MKNKTLRSAKHATLLLFLLLIGYSCSDDPVQQIEETQWDVVPVTIKKADWIWDNTSGRYEAIVDLPELTKFVYENGVQLGYVFIGQQNVDEVQKMLPYVKTWPETDELGNPILDDEGNFKYIYTETISCDFQIGTPSTVAFYIQASDLLSADDLLADYNFRVVLIW